MREFIFMFGLVEPEDIDLFCGPITGDEEIEFLDADDMAEVWVKAGLFKTKTQARKNNHGGPLPTGFTHVKKPKQHLDVCILNNVSDKEN